MTGSHVTKRLLGAFLLAVLPTICAPSPDDDPQDVAALNVNAHYIVERYDISAPEKPHLSDPLRTDLDHVVGQKLDHSLLEKLADRIKKELRAPDVKIRVIKGDMPDHVVVN